MTSAYPLWAGNSSSRQTLNPAVRSASAIRWAWSASVRAYEMKTSDSAVRVAPLGSTLRARVHEAVNPSIPTLNGTAQAPIDRDPRQVLASRRSPQNCCRN